jgi:hypothetical protein
VGAAPATDRLLTISRPLLSPAMVQADLAAVVDKMREGVTAEAPIDAQLGWNEQLWQPDLASVATIVVGRLLVGGGNRSGRVLIGPAAAVGLASRALQIHRGTDSRAGGQFAQAVGAPEALINAILTGDRLLAAASKMAVGISVQLAAALARYVGFVAAGSLQRHQTGAELTGTVLAGVGDVVAVTVGRPSQTMVAYGEQLGAMLDHIERGHENLHGAPSSGWAPATEDPLGGPTGECLPGPSGIGTLDELYRLVSAAASHE